MILETPNRIVVRVKLLAASKVFIIVSGSLLLPFAECLLPLLYKNFFIFTGAILGTCFVSAESSESRKNGFYELQTLR